MGCAKIIDTNCQSRIKPSLLRDVKTEALLVFTRTGLEGYFAQLQQADCRPAIGDASNSAYIYASLEKLLNHLQACVVDASYIQTLAHRAAKDATFSLMYQSERPLIAYYNVLVDTVAQRFSQQPLFLPDLLTLCALSIWILEEEKSTHLYPFLEEIDWLELISRYESNRDEFEKEGKCLISEIHDFSYHLIQKLKNKKFKIKTIKSKSKRRAVA